MAFDTVDDLYLYEIGVQAEFTVQAWDEALRALSDHETRRFRLSLQGVLISAGNVSKIPWPPSRNFSERGVRLRRRLDIPDDPIIQDRSFRNHLEHFDERLQAWFEGPGPPGFGDHNIGTVDSFGGGVNKPHWLRNYDPAQKELYFAGETLDPGHL